MNLKPKSIFDEEAELYHKVRPRYPEALFEHLIDATKLLDTSVLLEIGPGTGQATEPLANRGYNIVAIELGPKLARVAADNLKKYPDVKIINSAFEATDWPPKSFDLIYVATAFHWIEPKAGFSKSHKLLRPNGHLAIIKTEHVSDESGDKLFHISQPIYDRYGLIDDEEKYFPPRAEELKPQEIDTQLFEPILFKKFPVAMDYAAEEYGQLLSTYSSTRAMDKTAREGFVQAMVELIKRDFNGRITKPYVMTLTVARKKI